MVNPSHMETLQSKGRQLPGCHDVMQNHFTANKTSKNHLQMRGYYALGGSASLPNLMMA